jgi:hypothetical protein
MDEDLQVMTVDQLKSEVIKLRSAIREHRDCSGHNLCWYHPEMWSLLPEKSATVPVVPEWDSFMRGCVHYRKSLDEQLPNVPRSQKEFGEK